MGNLLGLGAKSVCGFFTQIQDDIQNGCQTVNFLIIHLKQLKLR